jgi:hypothetical protein
MKSTNAPATLVFLTGVLLVWLLSPAVDGAGAPSAIPPGQGGAKCQLVIEGKFIQNLTLVDRQGRPTQIARPSERVSLAPGEYRVLRVELQGGFESNPPSARDGDWFSVAPGEPYTLWVGAPLAPSVKVRRQGTQLQLDYELLDTGGRPYVDRGAAVPPRFAIYYDGHQIASDSFQYG